LLCDLVGEQSVFLECGHAPHISHEYITFAHVLTRVCIQKGQRHVIGCVLLTNLRVLHCFCAGLSPRKELLRALLAGDEEKAILIYTSVSNGKSLEENMYPSLPLLDNNHQTPMHLVRTIFRVCSNWRRLKNTAVLSHTHRLL
jgi:hypothetical protein